MYRFYWENNQWNHEILNINAPSNVGGAIAIRQADSKIYYQGTDNRIYNFYLEAACKKN